MFTKWRMSFFLTDKRTDSHLRTSVCADWCSEIGSLTSLDACNSGASSDHREPISLHQAVHTYARTHTRARAHTHTHTHSDRLMKRASYSCCNFLCIVLAAAYLKYHRCRLSCLPFVWHLFFIVTHTHIYTSNKSSTSN